MHASVTRLYGRAPVWAQHALCSAEGLRLRLRRYPPGFDAEVAREGDERKGADREPAGREEDPP